MMTVRQIERLWNARAYPRLLHTLLTIRPEAALRLEGDLDSRSASCAIAMIRLEELNQSHTEMYRSLLKALIAYQSLDGSWTDPLTTSLCLRALLAGHGSGRSVDLGLSYLSNLQKDEGIWPNEPIRRMPADAYVSAFILYQLSTYAQFRDSIRFSDAVQWFEQNEAKLDPPTRELWDRARLRCYPRSAARAISDQPVLVWS
jgi:hypothetical protein